MAPSGSPVCCILAADLGPPADAAIASALRSGLKIHVGLTTPGAPAPSADIVVHPVAFEGDFSRARNAVLETVTAEFVLWLDSDDELLSFPRLPWDELTGDLFAVRMQDRGDLSPRRTVRFQRRSSRVRWVGAVHERLEAEGADPEEAPLLPGLAVRHHGYEDADEVRRKTTRNLRLVRNGLRDPNPGYVELLCLARSETLAGRFPATLWLACFKHPAVQPRGYAHDRRYEAALMLASAGYVRPAQQVLERNPLIVGLHLALLSELFRRTERLDDERLDFVRGCLCDGFFDPEYPLPVELIGGSRERVEALVRAGWPPTAGLASIASGGDNPTA